MSTKSVLPTSLLTLALLLTGCGMGTQDAASIDSVAVAGAPIHGTLFGGRQPIIGASIYMYAADTTAYGHASDSLIQPYSGGSFPSSEDGNGNYYVTTNSSGAWELAASEYSCSAGQQVYVYSLGGDTGNGANSAASLMAVLGTCQSDGGFKPYSGASELSNVNMTEVSTVAAAYAFAGFATDATDVSSSSTSLASTGLANAFSNAASLFNVNSANGTVALSTTPNGNGTVPQQEINSIADILAACINTSSGSSSACSALFNNAKSNGSSGTTPTETATAAINIAHNPGNAVTTLFNIIPSIGIPWEPTLSTAPNDFTVAVTYADTGFDNPQAIAIDASGNAWITNSANFTITELSPTGVALSTPGVGYTTPDMSAPWGIAIDTAGNAWIADNGADLLIEIAPGDASYNEYSGGDLDGSPEGLAIDPYGNIWIAQNSNSAAEFSSTGTDLAATSGGTMSKAASVAVDTSGNIFVANDVNGSSSYGSVSKFNNGLTSNHSYGSTLHQKGSNFVAIDATGNFWTSNYNTSSITELSNTGVVVNSPGYYTGGGLHNPNGIAFDGSSHAWIANSTGSISEFTDSGVALTGGEGYAGGTSGNGLSGIESIAADGSGDIWVANDSAGNVTELIGAATPVVTPIVASLISPYSQAASKP